MPQDQNVDVERDVRRHRALSSHVRRRLLELLARTDGADARSLAEQLGLHVNTVRTHLALLEDAGLVTSTREDRDRPGRPKLLYRVTEPAGESEPADPRGYRFLAGMLASFLASSEAEPARAAERTGAAWGHYLIDAPAPFHAVEPTAAVARIVELLEEFGFEPELDAEDPSRPSILLHRCPFLDVAKEHPEIVCSIHLGLMRGALDELGVEVEARDLIPWAGPEFCVSHLEMPS